MKSEMDVRLDQLVLRATEFIHKEVKMGDESKNSLAELVECYIRQGFKIGVVSGMKQVRDLL